MHYRLCTVAHFGTHEKYQTSLTTFTFPSMAHPLRKATIYSKWCVGSKTRPKPTIVYFSVTSILPYSKYRVNPSNFFCLITWENFRIRTSAIKCSYSQKLSLSSRQYALTSFKCFSGTAKTAYQIARFR